MFAIYNLLNVPVTASREEVVSTLHSKLKPEAFEPSKANDLKELEEGILREHDKAFDLYVSVQRGAV